jgi:hypothetical protein
MKSIFKLSLVIAAALAAIIVGCTTQNPNYTPIPAGQPNTNTVPQFVVNPAVNTYSNAVSGVAGVVAPLNPYAGLTSWAITAIFGVVGGISTYVAKQKSGALGSMAAAVVQSGAHPAVLDAAANTPHFVAIADAINNNLGANQNLGSTTPPKV